MRAGFAKLFVVVLAALSAAALYRHVRSSVEKPNSGIPREVIALYASWKQSHGKLYATPAENDHRLKVFYSQKQFVDKANIDYAELRLKRDGEIITENPFSLNAFADLTEEEFAAQYAGEVAEDNELAEVAPEVPFVESTESALEQSGFDIRIRNQKSCGSCWAFSAVATYEKFYYLKTKQRLDFSQQQLVDCHTGSNGCNGGSSKDALAWMSGRTIALSSSYPYTAAQGSCKSVSGPSKLTFSVNKPTFSYSAAAARISEGLIISVSLYSSGKFRYLDSGSTPFRAADAGECSKEKNHAINAVAASNGSLQLLNSWGTGWGNQGLRWVTPCSSNTLWAVTAYVTSPQ